MITLLRNWVFMMFAVSNFLTSLGYPIPYSFVPVSFPGRCLPAGLNFIICLKDNAIQIGLERSQGSFLVGLIGISNTVARLILGIVSQKLNRSFSCSNFSSQSLKRERGKRLPCTMHWHRHCYAVHIHVTPQTVVVPFSGSGPRFLLSNPFSDDRLFLYNTCLVVCGISMGLNNYFPPMLVALAGAECGLDDGADPLPMVCDPYIGQLIYAVLYGITRYLS